MDGDRTFSQLATELEQVYGCNAASVFSIYVKHNPLKCTDQLTMEQYWEHTRRFLEQLHIVLYTKEHQLSLHNIKPESYFFLTKTCIDHSFTVTELINIRNDREHKYSKDIANEIAHHILPPYLTYRRQTINCSFDGSSIGPGSISQSAYMHASPMPFNPSQMHASPMPFNPSQMPVQMPPFSSMQMPFSSMQMPFSSMQMPFSSMQMPYPSQCSMIQPATRIKPTIKRKPTCIRKGEERSISDGHSLTMPPLSDCDNIPLNFYNVYCSEHANNVNASEDTHHVPQIFPVSNRPPPPSDN